MTKTAIFTYEYLEELNQTMQNLVAPDIKPLCLKDVWENTDNEGRMAMIVNYVNAIQHRRIEIYLTESLEKSIEEDKEKAPNE